MLEKGLLQEFRNLIESKIVEATESLHALEEDVKPVDLGESIGRLTRMDAIQQQHMAKAKQEQLRAHILKLNAALKRIEEGSFGLCLDCEELIPVARLKASPAAQLCVECSQRQ